MSKTTYTTLNPGAGAVFGLALLALMLLAVSPAMAVPSGEVESVIVKAASVETAAERVREVGGKVTHELGIIKAVAADVTTKQRAELEAMKGGVRIHSNHTASLDGKPSKNDNSSGGGNQSVETYYPTHLGADALHLEGIDGSGVTIVVLDSGVFSDSGLSKNSVGSDRVLAHYNAVTDSLANGNSLDEDAFGHGSHVTSVAVSSRQTESGHFNGMAPNADLVVVHAFDETGSSTYADVIRGVDWVVSNKDTYGIRVLNCSFSAEPQSYYWDDPLNQAVMEAWRAGIVVVASAGNRGPSAMTIGVPGNVPYIVTVGAMTDNYTPADMADDVLASLAATSGG
jgi:serine protease AprX